MRSLTRGALLGLAFVLLLPGCTSPRTEIIVVVDTDLAPPGSMDRVVIEVTAPGGEVQSASADLPGPSALPVTLGLVHEDGPLGPFSVRASGRLGDTEIVERLARVSFARERTVVLEMHLARRCVGATCPDGQTCTEDGCRSIEIGEGELDDWTGTPPRMDGGGPDGDADVDADVDGDVDADVDGDADGDADGDVDGDADGDVDGDADGDADAEVGCSTNGDCSDGVFCNGEELCDPDADGADANGCVPAAAEACLPSQTCDEAGDRCLSACDVDADADDDGVDSTDCGGTDCDDANAAILPGATELCNGVDDDCDPATADGSGETSLGNPCDGDDADLCEEGSLFCDSDAEALVCDDTSGDTPDLCNGEDDDCDPSTPDGSAECAGACCGSPLACQECCADADCGAGEWTCNANTCECGGNECADGFCRTDPFCCEDGDCNGGRLCTPGTHICERP